MRYLVTGGAGFIGSNLVMELLEKNQTVRVLDNFSTGRKKNIEPVLDKIELIEGDLRSYHIVREAVDGVDFVLHQGALPSVPRSINDPITSNEVNVSGTLNILNAAKDARVKRIVFASSSSIYGDSERLPKQEDMIPNPMSPYAVNKLAGEKYMQVFANIYNMHTVSLRYFNVFGPRQDPTSQYSAVIPKFIRAVMNDRKPTIFGDGLQSRDFTFVKNVVHANLLATETDCPPGMVFNCACHERIDLKFLVKQINEILGKNIPPEFLDERPGDIKHSFADIDRIQKYLDYQPQVLFNEGLRRTIKWYENSDD